jgi:hypothetical protein
VITKDFHLTNAFRQIRGKSFVIMVGVTAATGLSGHTRRLVARRPAHIVWHGSRCTQCTASPGMGEAGVAVIR